MTRELVRDGVVTAGYWSRLASGKLKCELCPRGCELQDGQAGFCFVRRRENDRLVLATYGRSSGFCIDPIEKKPLYQFLPGSAVLSFGTAGCNLGCKFCQNWDISKSRATDSLSQRALPEEIARAAADSGCSSVAFTYNDPVIFLEYAADTAAACRAAGVKAVAVTAGYISDRARPDFFRDMDAANVDLKGFSEDFYHKLCGGHLGAVLDTLRYLRHETAVWLEITTLLIPGENDSEQELDRLTSWIVETLGADVPLHFTAYHPDYKFRERPRTPIETLKRAKVIAHRNGMHYVYTGNVIDDQGSATTCHDCGSLLIVRRGSAISDYRLDPHGCCSRCGMQCAGVFAEVPGTWTGGRKAISF